MSKKTDSHSVFTTIEDYVRAKFPDFASLLDYCKLFNLTQPRNSSGGAGVTLVIPTAKEYIDSIRDLAFSPDPEKVGRACDSLLALMMRKAMRTAADWTMGDVSDMRFPSQQITAKASASSVELQFGSKTYATLKQDPGFKVGFRSNIAVWLLTDGRMRDQMDAEAPRKQRSGRSRGAPKMGEGVTGGYDLTKSHADSDRFKIAVLAENEFVIQHMQGAAVAAAGGQACVCPFLTYMMSFARFTHERHPEEFYQCVLPLIRFRVTDFYSLFEPHRAVPPDQYLINDSLISEWWTTFQYLRFVQDDVIKFRKWIDERLTEAQSHVKCAIYTAPADLADAIDTIRGDLTPVLQSATKIPDAVYGAYTALATTNRVGSFPEVFPPMLADYYRRHPLFKLMQDELAFVIEPLMIRVCKAFSPERFREIVTIIGNAMHADSQSEIEAKLPLVSRTKLTSGLANDGLIAEIRTFINSTMFFWIPVTSAIMANYPIESSTTRPEGADVIYNTDLALALHHQRVYSDMSARIADMNKELALAALRAIDKSHLSAELQAKIAALTQ